MLEVRKKNLYSSRKQFSGTFQEQYLVTQHITSHPQSLVFICLKRCGLCSANPPKQLWLLATLAKCHFKEYRGKKNNHAIQKENFIFRITLKLKTLFLEISGYSLSRFLSICQFVKGNVVLEDLPCSFIATLFPYLLLH